MKYNLGCSLIIILFVLSCQHKNGAEQNKYMTPLIREVIYKYADRMSVKSYSDKILTVDFSKKGDMIQISMANSYPDTTACKVIGYESINSYNVFIINNKTNNYYKSNSQQIASAQSFLRKLLKYKFGGKPLPGFNYIHCNALINETGIVNTDCP